MPIPLILGVVVALVMAVVAVLGYLMDQSAERHELDRSPEHHEVTR